MRHIITTACALALAALPFRAFASAWTQNQGSGQAILTGTYYDTSSYWSNQGHKQSEPTYSQYDLNPYIEYGLTSDITVGTNFFLLRDHQDGSTTGTSQTSWGLGDSEFFLRKRLWQGDGLVFSAQPMVKLPSPTDTMPKLGGSSPDAGLGLSGGYSFIAWGLQDFADIDTQYRHRFGTPKDQVNLAGTVGISVSPSWMIMPQTFFTYRTTTPTNAVFTNSGADDYNLITMQLSAVYKVTDETSLQFGGFDHVAGRNTGSGDGVLFAVWKKF